VKGEKEGSRKKWLLSCRIVKEDLAEKLLFEERIKSW
jgi:hypothetical protein